MSTNDSPQDTKPNPPYGRIAVVEALRALDRQIQHDEENGPAENAWFTHRALIEDALGVERGHLATPEPATRANEADHERDLRKSLGQLAFQYHFLGTLSGLYRRLGQPNIAQAVERAHLHLASAVSELQDARIDSGWKHPAECLIQGLARRRRSRNISRADLAAELGWTEPDVEELENGEGEPTLSALQQYARALGARLDIEIGPQ